MAVTPNKGYELQSTGSNVGTWGTELNNNVFGIVDNNLGGIATVGLSSSNVTLTATQAQNACIQFTGALTANVVVTSPAVGFYFVENLTTGNYSVTISNGVGSTYIPPQLAFRTIFADASSGVRAIGLPAPGLLIPYGGDLSSIPPWLGGELVAPYGQAVSRAGTTARLFSVLGTTYGAGDGSTTFNLPDLRGRIPLGRDDLGGSAASRITSAGSGIAGTTLGAVGGAQNVTLTLAQLAQHNHGVNDPGHNHTYARVATAGTVVSQASNDVQVASGLVDVSTNTIVTGVTTQASGSNQSHNNMPPGIIMNYLMTL